MKAKNKSKSKSARAQYKATKGEGNPFIAFRVPGALLKAFDRYAAKRKTTTTAALREHMAKATGVKL